MRKRQIAALALSMLMLLSGCSASGAGSSASAGSVTAAAVDTAGMFTDRDYEIGYEESESTLIELAGDSAQCDSSAVQITGSTVTITAAGTYLLTGTLDNGMILIDAADTDAIHLVLSGANISNAASAALYVRRADKVFVTTAAGTENSLSSTGEYEAIDENNIDAAVFSKSDLTLNGAGSLTVQAAAGHGVVSKDDLVIISGTYTITAAGHGLAGKDSVRIANGTFTITSGKDGIHAENSEDAALGFLYILDGTFRVVSAGDGLSAGSYLQLDGGSLDLLCGGGSSGASINRDVRSSATAEDSVSTKGIKADGDLILKGGSATIDSLDDGIHSNASISISGGSFQISTGDDGIHADAAVAISSGAIQISRSYEGIEGLTIEITGGEIELTASDDGLNAAGGTDQSGTSGFGGGFRGEDDFRSGSDAAIRISGGTLHINASGDGIDSNGSLTISGGTIYLSGPDSGGNGALDYDSEASITGGILIAAGASQMAQNFGSSSTQGAMLVTVAAQQAGITIALADSSGKELLSWTADKAFDSVLISCPEITQGATYTLTAGTSQTEVTMGSLVYTAGGSAAVGGQPGGGMGGAPGQPGARPA